MSHSFNYPEWGLAEKSRPAIEIKAVKPLSKDHFDKAIVLVTSNVDLRGFKLKTAGLVEHYQGKNAKPARLAVMRFEREDGKNTQLHGEHISAAVDIDTLKLMGFTRMQAHLIGDAHVSHQTALDIAINFLKSVAPDLMPQEVIIPELPQNSLSGDKMDFEDKAFKIGQVELQWIGDHKEDIVADNKPVEVHGMKVKMYIPASELWAWVIIDKHGNIETFERNIFWNFKEFRRETQMWLHDKWLDAQQITL